jgi:hypothetical protein
MFGQCPVSRRCRRLTNTAEPVRRDGTRETGVVCEKDGKAPLIRRVHGDELLTYFRNVLRMCVASVVRGTDIER